MKNPEFDILGIGAPFWDYILLVSEDFLSSLTQAKGGVDFIDATAFRRIIDQSKMPVTLAAGGSCANAIKGLAHLGHRCALLGKVGADEAGKTFSKRMRELDIVPMLIPGKAPTGQVIALVTPDGERTMRDFLGASQEMKPEDLDPDAFSGVKWVHIEGYMLMRKGVAARAMELAKAAGARISFDLANFELVLAYKSEIISLVSKYVDVLFANGDETRALTKRNPQKGCAIMRDLCEVAVVSMGKEGCWIADGIEEMHCPAYPVQPVDTTGAGDLFAAGFLHGYLRNKPLPLCAHYGAKIAAAVVQVMGAELPQVTWQALKEEFDNNS
ncbi:MAG: adenosine kinase [Parachlamydia sp.]|nr:adenosine kinase [Parachlamydia sp.]